MVIIKLLVVIALLLVLIFKKVNMALSLLIASVSLMVLNSRGPLDLWNAVVRTLTDSLTRETALIILFIGILGYLMNRYKMLERMVMYLERLVRSTKLTIMLAPSLMGLLLVTGGALMSCPVVDTLGERLQLPGDKRAAINLIFRHGLYFIYPLSSTLIMAAKLGGFQLYELVRIQFPVSLLMYFLGYVLLLRGVKDAIAPKLSGRAFGQSLLGFLINSSPITATILITVLGIPFHYSLPVGIVLAIIINLIEGRKDSQYKLAENPLKLLWKGVNINMVLIILAVFFFKGCIDSITEINAYVLGMVEAGIPLELVIAAICMLVTFPTSNFQPSLAIAMPFITAVSVSQNQLLTYTYLLYSIGFLAYYASPLHMCQVLTVDYFKISLGALMKQYKLFIPILAAFTIGWYFVLRAFMV